MQGKNMMYVAFVAAEASIFGLGNVLMKIAYAGITPLWCSTLRFGLAFAVFMLFFGRKSVPQLKAAGLKVWLPTSLCMAVSYIACALAVAWTSATNAGFFISLPMLFAPALSLVLLRRSYRMDTALLQLAVLIGLYLLSCNGGGLGIGAGEIAGLLCSACIAGSMVLSERCSGELDAMAVSTAQTGVTFAVALVGALVSEPLPAFAAISGVSWAAIAFLAVVGTCVAFFLQNAALAHIPSSTVSVVLCAEPVVTAAISAFVLGEMLTMLGAIGCLVVVACTVMSSALEGRPDPVAAAVKTVRALPAARKLPALATSTSSAWDTYATSASSVVWATRTTPSVNASALDRAAGSALPAGAFETTRTMSSAHGGSVSKAPKRAVNWMRYTFMPLGMYDRKDAA